VPDRVLRRAAFAAFLALALVASAEAARVPRLASDVEVRALSFRFVGKHELIDADLTARMATTAPGMLDEAQGLVAWIQLIPDPARHPFNPRVLQEDVVRLRHYYRRQGFLETSVDYDVRTDRRRRWVKVKMTVSEGRPLALRSLALADSGGAALEPDSQDTKMVARWAKIRSAHLGSRFREEELDALRADLLSACDDHGHALAVVEPLVKIDSAAYAVDVVCRVSPGARLRIASLDVTGTRSVPPRLVTRQLALRPGDVVSRGSLAKGRANLQSVALFRRADVTLGAVGSDSLVPVKVTVTEGPARFTNLELGYVTDGAGVTSQARWTHPNFTGGARSLDAIMLVQTVWCATGREVPDRLLRTSLTLTQPYVGSPVVTLSLGPAIEARDGPVDKSRAWSALATLVYRFNPLRSAALRYDYTYRKLEELGFRELGSDVAFGTLVDSLKAGTRTSQFILFTTLGGFDNLSRPRHGFVLKPNLSVTAPPGAGNIEFARADFQGTFFAPIPGRANALMLRGTLGGLWPFGHSIPESGGSAVLQWFRLRDQVLTAGGANDVRGYSSRLLGPKVPSIVAEEINGDTVLTSDHYLPVGGLRRATATAELRLGIPWFGRDVFGHLFADMGRVWNTDDRFALPTVPEEEYKAFYTTGGGLGYYTPVGAIRLDVGYKLNPSDFDVRDPGEVLAATLAGRPASSAPVHERMRFNFHLSLGLFF
jgi:outer membrane protein insertion porin family